MSDYLCSMCSFSTSNYSRYCHHIVSRHRNEANFFVNCRASNCMYSTKNWNAFKVHVWRSHSMTLSDNSGNDIDDDDPCENLGISDCGHSCNDEERSCAAYMLQMEAEHKLSQKALDNIAICTNNLVVAQVNEFKNELKSKLVGCESVVDSQPIPQCLSNFSSRYNRRKFYEEKCGLISCVDVQLSEKYVRHKGQLVARKQYGYIVPFRATLSRLLNMPEVWSFVCSKRCSDSDVMMDICDGQYIRNHSLFTNENIALQIILSCDDMEVVNPLGSHVKKHKLCMFYFTLGNIPPAFRSKLSAIHLLGVAKSQHLRNSCAVRKLLSDFVSTVRSLRSTGINVKVNGTNTTVHGDLVMCPCDTLAAQWLGGFKEGVSFALKACRTCTASSALMKTKFLADDFREREASEYLRHCTALESMANPKAKQYWSKMWGINSRSPLLDISEDLSLSTILVHDPMHVLLEGVVPYELALLLHHLLYQVQTPSFTLLWLNAQLQCYCYSYIDGGRKPEPILQKDIASCKIKQTSAGMLTLCYILPHILGTVIPENCTNWRNFLRLLQIVLICTSPYASVDTAGQLQQMIITHHLVFMQLYPRASVIPKMHYCIHLPKQILMFGPLRNQWCMRYEGKHGFFKNHKWRSFRNIQKSLAEKHELWMCYKMFTGEGPNMNYLYSGDVVVSGLLVEFDKCYPTLLDSMISVLTLNPAQTSEGLLCYKSPEVTIHGHTYRAGVAVCLSVHDDIPQFALIEDIFVINDVKVFVVEQLITVQFEQNLNSYCVEPSGHFVVKRFVDLQYTWPLPVFASGGLLYIVDRYCHVGFFIM